MESPLCTTAQGSAHMTGRQSYLSMLQVSLCRLAFCRSPEWKADCTANHQCQSGAVWCCSALAGLHASMASPNLHPDLTFL